MNVAFILISNISVGREASACRGHAGPERILQYYAVERTFQRKLHCRHLQMLEGNQALGGNITNMACTWFRRHRVRCFDGTGGGHGEAEVHARAQA
jgi:hypothetical protein